MRNLAARELLLPHLYNVLHFCRGPKEIFHPTLGACPWSLMGIRALKAAEIAIKYQDERILNGTIQADPTAKVPGHGLDKAQAG